MGFFGDLWDGITGKSQADAARYGADSANEAARMFAERQEEANAFGLARAYQMMYGNDWGSKLMPGLNERQRGLLGFGEDGSYSGAGGDLGGGLLSQYGGLANQSGVNYGKLGQQHQGAMNRFNSAATAEEFGRGREAQIRQDADRDLKGRNAMTRAALAGSGFTGSTTLANQMAGNADDTTRARDRSITDLNMAKTDRVMAGQNAMRQSAMQGIARNERGMNQKMGYQEMPLQLQSQLAFSAMNPGAVQAPSAGLSAQGSGLAAQGNHWMNLLGMGLGGASLFF